MGLTEDDYMDAIRVQDACNLSGILHSWLRTIARMREDGLGTDGTNHHVVSRMYASKVAYLTGAADTSRLMADWDECERMSRELLDGMREKVEDGKEGRG